MFLTLTSSSHFFRKVQIYEYWEYISIDDLSSPYAHLDCLAVVPLLLDLSRLCVGEKIFKLSLGSEFEHTPFAEARPRVD